MTLAFSTKIKENPTYFVEKIWKGFSHIEITEELAEATHKHNFNWGVFNSLSPKIHTIRKDSKNRWKVGNNIHFVINNRTKNRFQFAPTAKVKSIQEIRINPDAGFGLRYVIVDGKTLTGFELDELIQNDGFDTLEDFWSWFNEDFTGKIIHWTDLRY